MHTENNKANNNKCFMILPFELDPQIIHHIIYSQAGSIGKALIELIMNSVDAGARSVRLNITRDGFDCSDDGNGFVSKEDVVRYFGRFGTPHQEGDATYGRFRLGRGQIMAHARTVWQSNNWEMSVDTRSMGYNYNLKELSDVSPGCKILGTWYEQLSEVERMSTVQEVRDLVRYTPVNVQLNGKSITRNPAAEKWDHEDEYAYYRVKEDGAVSIYNQGVLVRHDSGHIWGAGGLIVSKQAIGLNVSRTEILRKTDPVWKAIARQFKKMAEEISLRIAEHRKTEVRREKSAKALLSGDAQIANIFAREEVVTVLPKRHITMQKFLFDAKYDSDRGKPVTVIEDGFDVPKGEAIAKQNIATVVHPKTLERFECYSTAEFKDMIERVLANVGEDLNNNPSPYWVIKGLTVPEFASFEILKANFLERTKIVMERDALDKETRRAWTALRGCLQHYCGMCSSQPVDKSGRLDWRTKRMHILLGESNTTDAWTDGQSYIAIEIRHVKRLKSEPLKAVSYIFSLVEHEVAHEGDSIECGHDEAFYQRYHEISFGMSEQRQRYIHLWLVKYTSSLESSGKRNSGNAWRELRLLERAGDGRQKRSLPRIIEDLVDDPVVTAEVPDESMSFIESINSQLPTSDLSVPPPDWGQIIEHAKTVQAEREAQWREAQVDSEFLLNDIAFGREQERERIHDIYREEISDELVARLLGIHPKDVSDEAIERLLNAVEAGEEWATKPLHDYVVHDFLDDDRDFDCDNYSDWDDQVNENSESELDTLAILDAAFRQENGKAELDTLDAAFRQFVNPGENLWTIERNAAAAGFDDVEEYLQWRSEDN